MGWRDTTLTIPNGQTESQELDLQENAARRKKNITFLAPAALTGTVAIHVADKVGGTYRALNDGFGNDAVIPANKAVVQAGITAGALKLVSSAAEAADRVFGVKGTAEK